MKEHVINKSKRLRLSIFLVVFGIILFLLVLVDRYCFRHSILDGSFWSPIIVIEPQSVDFGDISPTNDAHREITVKNVGRRNALIIERVQPSCAGCIVIHSYSKDPIFPGKREKIKFSLNVSGMNGEVATSFVVISNSVSQRSIVIKVTANVLAEDK